MTSSVPKSFTSLFANFTRDYLSQPIGRKHLATTEQGRTEAKANYASILAERAAGRDVADRVLLQLLPYQDLPESCAPWGRGCTSRRPSSPPPASGSPRTAGSELTGQRHRLAARADPARSQEPQGIGGLCEWFDGLGVAKGFRSGP